MTAREVLDSPLWGLLDGPVVQADCRDAVRFIPDCSIEAVVTDAPYEIGFMGGRWDRTGIAYDAGWWSEVLRVLKPGGHLLVFGSPRTYHRLGVAVEDAGFEIRDSIGWWHEPNPSATGDILSAWLEWSGNAKGAGVRFVRSPTEAGRSTNASDSVPDPVLLAANVVASPARAVLAELQSHGRPPESEEWHSALWRAAGATTASSVLVSVADESSGDRGARSSDAPTAPGCARLSIDASTVQKLRAVEALQIWLGSGPSSKRAATDALCAALTDDLRLITCAQSRTFQSYDTWSQTASVSATTAITTACTAAHLISFTVDTLAAQGGDAKEAPGGPLAWMHGEGFP